MFSLKQDRDIYVEKVKIPASDRKISALILSPKAGTRNAPGIRWIHGGGYFVGMKEMVYMSRAVDLVKKYGAVVISPGYRMALQAPYPAAIEDCYRTLIYLKENVDRLHINSSQIMVGGESAGGGLCAVLCMMARDRQEVNIAYQMPLYPMLDNLDTDSSRDNHGKVWNTRKNHFGWKTYLRKDAKKLVSPYAAPARQTDYSDLPPAYTFVGDGEPFYRETQTYIENLKKAGTPAEIDVYHCDMHAFDMLQPKSRLAKKAAGVFNRKFDYAMKNYFAPQVHGEINNVK